MLLGGGMRVDLTRHMGSPEPTVKPFLMYVTGIVRERLEKMRRPKA